MKKYILDLKEALTKNDQEEIDRLLRQTNIPHLGVYELTEACEEAAQMGNTDAIRKIAALAFGDNVKSSLLGVSFYKACVSGQVSVVRDLFLHVDKTIHSESLQRVCQLGLVPMVATLAPLCSSQTISKALKSFVKNNNKNKDVLEELYKYTHKKVIKNILKPSDKTYTPDSMALVKKRVKLDEDKRELIMLLHKTSQKKENKSKPKM